MLQTCVFNYVKSLSASLGIHYFDWKTRATSGIKQN